MAFLIKLWLGLGRDGRKWYIEMPQIVFYRNFTIHFTIIDSIPIYHTLYTLHFTINWFKREYLAWGMRYMDEKGKYSTWNTDCFQVFYLAQQEISTIPTYVTYKFALSTENFSQMADFTKLVSSRHLCVTFQKLCR